MGRYDFRALRVRPMAKALVDTRRNPALPPWYDIVGDIPPGETLARPVQRAGHVKGKSRKPSRMFQPMPIAYPEDDLRQTFFGEHPWELARPRLVVEDSGNDAKHHDWSKIAQSGKQLDGESVVQRQMWLMKHQGLSKPEAYDQARGEFYRHRHLEALRLRIAKEEALHVGAYFAKGPNEIGMELEDKAFESWKAWAGQQIENETQMRAQMFSGPTAAEDTNEMDDNEYAEALQEVGDSVPKSREGQSALGGAAMHP